MKTSKIILTLALFGFVYLAAQTNRFYYNVSFKKDSLSDNYTRKVSVLDIEKDKVKFYPEDFLIKDSIRIETGEYDYSYNNFEYQLIRDRNTGLNNNFVAFSPNYYCFTTNDSQSWHITKETKNIDGLELQKATASFGGRYWEAWFAPSFPFQEGPYKFRGLPGLIVELKDEKEQFIFQLYRSANLSSNYDTSFYLENLNERKPLKISETDCQKMKMNYFLNPLKDYEGQNLMVTDQFGNIKKMNSKDLILQQQQQLIKYNNPIELDKAIRYPK